MSYDGERKKYIREKITIVELDLDYCENTFSVSPCTATGTGDAKCFNTLASCQDKSNYAKESKTYRLYSARSPAPIGISSGLDVSAIPCLTSVNITPSEIDISGGLGTRANVTAAFNDFGHSDIGVDKYVSERSWIASDRGTFWTKLRARNPNYENRPMRVLDGFLVNGEFDIANFETHYFIIDTLDVADGRAAVKGKDILKLAMDDKAQVPKPSTGQLSGAITDADTSLTLTTGTGAEYGSSGKILIDKEICSFTGAGDTKTITRAQNNTEAAAHNDGATVQLCYELGGVTVNVGVEDILTNYASVDSSYINSSEWQDEADDYINWGITGLIPKPTSVKKVLQELSQAAPHYLHWSERQNKIIFLALKQETNTSTALNMDDNLIAGLTKVKERNNLRYSTIYVNYGQINPVKNLDEPDNYEKAYVRVDTDSIAFYDNVDQVKVINCRWLPAGSAASASALAALLGRRFANAPREVHFALDFKDSELQTGFTRNINYREMVDFTGEPEDILLQIISEAEKQAYFMYKGLEFTYGDPVDGDEGGGNPDVDLIIIDSDTQNANIKSLWVAEYPTSTNLQIKCVVKNGAVVGSSSTGLPAMDTGFFGVTYTVALEVKTGSYIVGAGGAGSVNGAAGSAGGLALNLSDDLTINNSGIIGGGGGGGGANELTTGGANAKAAGGGGAGDDAGTKGAPTSLTGGSLLHLQAAEDGSLETGGSGGVVEFIAGPDEPFAVTGGDGGDLGQAGESRVSAGGAAGAAIDKNGFTLTGTTGDTRGSILA